MLRKPSARILVPLLSVTALNVAILLVNLSFPLACTRFRRHRVRCFDGTGGVSWRDGSLHGSSSLRRFG